jgi:hypothetical protein
MSAISLATKGMICRRRDTGSLPRDLSGGDWFEPKRRPIVYYDNKIRINEAKKNNIPKIKIDLVDED